MNEYKVVYWEESTGDVAFEPSVRSKFLQEINQLAQEGWLQRSPIQLSHLIINREQELVHKYYLKILCQ